VEVCTIFVVALRLRYATPIFISLLKASVLRTRESTLSEESALHVGKLLGINPTIVLIDQVCERAKSEESKHAWQHAISLVTRAAPFNNSHAKQKT
jgi:hypothetical protein